MDRDELLAGVVSACLDMGLLWHHCPPGPCQGSPGFPDLVIAGSRGVLFAVLVTARMPAEASRDPWMQALPSLTSTGPAEGHSQRQGGAVAFGPGDLDSGRVSQVLRSIT